MTGKHFIIEFYFYDSSPVLWVMFHYMYFLYVMVCACVWGSQRHCIPGAAHLLGDELPDKGVRPVSVPLKKQYSILITVPFLQPLRIPFLSDNILPMSTLSLLYLYTHCTDNIAPYFKASFLLIQERTFIYWFQCFYSIRRYIIKSGNRKIW